MVTTDNTGNFIVHLLDSNGNTVEFLANEIGPVDQSTVINVKAGTYILDVQCEGTWTITVQQ
jgi:hypothetical protein